MFCCVESCLLFLIGLISFSAFAQQSYYNDVNLTLTGTQLRDALADIPLDKLLLETDSPYLFPKTLKSKSRNNQPANLPHIAKTVADIKDVELQYLKQSCWRNTIRFFDLDLSSEV